ncbi:hypothetical protein [Flavobacterium phycosphaerae]|uniref:hypothetical protein n=1 Tax=Flavobacterium phycosphaerae TaxID=2697515 RepID=UPI00138AE5C4|nr:hypothetical protein [Flavobacterium phycosphaerae]
MSDTTNYKPFQALSSKDIESLLFNISERTAQQYLTDIKRTYDLKVVTYYHFKMYFKIG